MDELRVAMCDQLLMKINRVQIQFGYYIYGENTEMPQCNEAENNLGTEW